MFTQPKGHALYDFQAPGNNSASPQGPSTPTPRLGNYYFVGFYHLYILGRKCNREQSCLQANMYLLVHPLSLLLWKALQSVCGYQASEHSLTHSAQHHTELSSRASSIPTDESGAKCSYMTLCVPSTMSKKV